MVDSTKFEPMKPAPPVTSSMRGLSPNDGSLLPGAREPQAEKQRGEGSVLVMQGRVDDAGDGGDHQRSQARPPEQPVVVRILGPRPPALEADEPCAKQEKQHRKPDRAPLGDGVHVQTVRMVEVF